MIGPVEDGVAIPRKKGGMTNNANSGLTAALLELEVKQSRVFSGEILRGSLTGRIGNIYKTHGRSFVTRSVDGGIRVWRVE